MFEKRKNGQFAVLGFLRDLSSGREPLFNVGNLMGEILPQKLLTLKEWVQMAYLQILTREQSIERERNEQHIGACLYYTSCFLTLCFSFHSPFFLFDFYVTSFLSFLFASFLSHSFSLFLTYFSLLSLVLAPPFPHCAQPMPFYTVCCDGFYCFTPQLLLFGCGCPSQTIHQFVSCPAITTSQAGDAMFHSQTKECCFVILFFVAFPFG